MNGHTFKSRCESSCGYLLTNFKPLQMETLTNYDHAKLDLATGQYRTYSQFLEVMDSAFHGVYSQAKAQYEEFCFDPVSYIEHIDQYCDGLVNDNVKIELLTQLVYIID